MVVTDCSVGLSPGVQNKALHPMSSLSLTLCPAVVFTGPCMGGKHCRLWLITMPLRLCPCPLSFRPTMVVTDLSMSNQGHLALACHNTVSLLSVQRRSIIVITGLDVLFASMHSTP